MKLTFIAQPDQQVGQLLTTALSSSTKPLRVDIVSAFASLQAVLRLKNKLLELHSDGTQVQFVIGVDMGGTSKEVLLELATWPVKVMIFRNRKGNVTFHPKLYVIESESKAEIFLGSNNLTDGGLYGNYEGAINVAYDLPEDSQEFENAKNQLSKFLNPSSSVARQLDAEYLELLMCRTDIPTIAESKRLRAQAKQLPIEAPGDQDESANQVEVFGYEKTTGAPPLGRDVQSAVLDAVREQVQAMKEAKKKAEQARKAAEKNLQRVGGSTAATITAPNPLAALEAVRNFEPVAELTPAAFYLELTTTGKEDVEETGKRNIPGEQRIPLEALHVAHEFWGWPHNYNPSVNPRKGENAPGEDRIYLNWKPLWKIYSVNDESKEQIKAIRMYYYVNSSDFRFYSSALSDWASSGDIIRITRCDDQPYVYECALAEAGTPEHTEWQQYCAPGTDTDRVFGFS